MWVIIEVDYFQLISGLMGGIACLCVSVYCCWCVGGLILFKGLTKGNDLFSRSLLLVILLVMKRGSRMLELVK